MGSPASALWGPGQPWPSGPLEDHLSCFCLPCPPSAVAVLLCDPASPDLDRHFPARRPRPVSPAQGLSSPLLQGPGESHSTQHIVALLWKGQEPPTTKNVLGLQHGSWNSELLRKKKKSATVGCKNGVGPGPACTCVQGSPLLQNPHAGQPQLLPLTSARPCR